MKKILLILTAAFFMNSAIAQDLPQPSPKAKIEQTVGLTEISIDYSRPSLKGRKVFGELVEFNKVWRLGANACTKITNSTDMNFDGQTLKAGTYAVFAIPSESGKWKIIFNTDIEQWGAGNYDEKKNVVTVETMAKANASTETLTLNFDNVTNNTGVISIKWESLMVTVPFKVRTQDVAVKNIDDAISKGENLDEVYRKASAYYLNTLKKNDMALEYANKSIAVKKSHKNYYLKAQILKAKGQKAEAVKLGMEAYDLAVKAESKGWADYISENVEEWKK